MKLVPEKATEALAFYAWKCAELETMCQNGQRALDFTQGELDKAKAALKAASVQPAPKPADVVSEGGTPD